MGEAPLAAVFSAVASYDRFITEEQANRYAAATRR